MLLLLRLLDTFAYSCVSATAISSALPLTVRWLLTETGRWEEGAREGGNKKLREKKRQLKKKTKNKTSNLLRSFPTKAYILFS